MRFLFVVPPFTGHVNPTIAVAAELARRGHETAWCGPDEIEPLLPVGATRFPAGDAPVGGYARLYGNWKRLRGVAALHFLVADTLVPLAHAMMPGVTRALTTWRPDVVVSDQQAFAGAFAADRAGLPWATSATTSAEFTQPLVDFPRVEAWVRARLAEAAGALGARAGIDPRFSERLVVVFSTPELVGLGHDIPTHHRYVGPAFGPRGGDADDTFPWDRLAADRKRLLVSLGTLNQDAGERFYAAVVEATRPLADRVQVVLVAPAHLAGKPAEHTLVRDFVPQLALLPHLDAVVTHGGHNTVCEALSFGLPLVVAPIRDDQPIVARQVVAAGAGVRVRFGRAYVPEIQAAVTRVLDSPELREGALRVRESFAAAGGAAAAARYLEALR